jgi:trigger factor
MSENQQRSKVMRVDVERREDGEVALKIALDAEEVNQEVEKVFKEVAKSVQVPGFRPGKAPRSMIESHLSMNLVRQEALEQLTNNSFSDALEQTGLEPINQPKLEEGTPQEDGGFTYQAVVTVMPEVKLGEYKGLKVRKPVATIDDAVIDNEITRLRQRYETLAPAPESPIESGDIAVIDYGLEVEGALVEEAAVNGYPLEVGADTLFPELNEGLLGAKEGETRRIDGTLSETYTDEKLAGKDCVFVITVKDVKRPTMPPLDDDFAKKLRVESVEELRNRIREALENQSKRMSDEAVREQLATQVTDSAETELPSILIERFRDNRRQEIEANLAQQGVTLDDYLQRQGVTREAWLSTLDRDARRSLKRHLALREIERQEGITVTDEELEAEILIIAQQQGQSPMQIQRELEANESALDDLTGHIKRNKVYQLLEESAEITEEALTPGEKPETEAEAEAEIADVETGDVSEEAIEATEE